MPGSSVNRGSMIGSSVSRGSMIVPTRELQGGMGGRSYAGSSGYSVYGLQDSQYHPLMVGEGGVLTSKGGSSNMSYVPQIPFESGQLPDRYSMGPDSSQMLNRLETVRSVSQPIMMSGGNTTYSQFSYSTAGVSSTLTGRRYSGQPAEAVARSSAASSHSTQQGNTALTSSTSHLTSRRSSYSQPLPPSQSPASTRMHNPPHQPAARSSAPSFWHPRGMLSDPGQFAVQDVAALMAGMSLDRQGSHNAAAAAVGMMHPPPTGMGMPMMIFPGEYQHMGMPHDQYFAFYQQQGVAADYYAPANYYYPALMPTSNPPSARPSFSNVHNTQLTPARIAQQHYVNSPGSVPYTQTSPQGRGGQLLVRQHSSQYEGGSSRGYSSQLLRGRGNHLIRHRSSGPLEVALQVNN
ncbi:hypothetical protein CEUSTIGMA_g1680.t1 [Chlamydomonas eustigma]|uniref:Uncharacterized protein n=1 Tax=Chlamydomonas eustigma TaxID=1157962 RepID=A0A250WTT1_9CHLO|nr:hypothetical protein CEUSTIGMA_g1680.t1 [Chlamydomonas eustigma]|eukprot:GAX74231.1 hypothetical protein CEUSTIGMA_g1680.t1 [Chlamydomonas eustigma]